MNREFRQITHSQMSTFNVAKRAAQPAIPTDAATRRQDRDYFGSQKRPNVIPIHRWRRS